MGFSLTSRFAGETAAEYRPRRNEKMHEFEALGFEPRPMADGLGFVRVVKDGEDTYEYLEAYVSMLGSK